MDVKTLALQLHRQHRGKIALKSKVSVDNQHDLSIYYTPGVAEPCREIVKNKFLVYEYTSKSNWVAVVTNGTAVLGLGDIGVHASLPVMEGKAILFKQFGGVDAFPICIDSKDVEEIVKTVKLIETSFGGINLEDIAAPACFEIEQKLIESLDIPVFHDDQHGTAVVALAALINSLKIVRKRISDVKIVINGAGAAGIATAKLLLKYGARNIVICDKCGAIYEGREKDMNKYKEEIARITNKEGIKGSLHRAIEGADVFIGLSVANVLNEDDIKKMSNDAIVMAMANPIPEIMPDIAKKAGARIVCTGRSDFNNQVNNVLAFPGIFRGALDVMATRITDEMKIAAAEAIAKVAEEELSEDYVIPKPFDKKVAFEVALAVAKKAVEQKVARLDLNDEELRTRILSMLNI
ncbi:malate dehydrogenase (oxaloacetate-decarboxylating) [Caldicellulosiruptor bescii]|uniref:Malate dehydrogenase (Oxaloacetate-decarboxylating) (NADP(+)) n=2 Tax=Caldicellulosiruptor bescii TaxID=31899 RepID=B9MR59_CALBD|nr:NADP-dependent malic enzyme [Caldicellulosiruptor bescii]ACM60163.1 Malate dehydrogenase (oxaloacetate-decarboxylating) (NADP(+)) [Caldicellulosiruptor bescii DSM 6725]PBC87578.1 malate dehydrogenase (oxaloacetate-decarboxylating) [Caldicellulosiruptor bescii]PBC90511.1 malate dehydrogenase (oxaloacetate-decarboxylating) [Caldicellulosiruptor bescii]PBD04057.1 malate dehydrogenase (oxaloacetate-decarboxylating) [Caldicellulosiruptor bescii]PBD06308.1 malate dehydrogenase (oxaloacetate-decar